MSLLKKFTREESVSNVSNLKSSVTRGIRAKIQAKYPWLDENGVLDVIFPKKETVKLAKCADRVQLLVIGDEPLFFNHFDGPWMPTLRLLHKYPDMMPRFTVDAGAIKFVLSGAHIMCPGLTHPDASMADVDEHEPVAVYAAGKQHALAVGFTQMSSQQIREVNKGVGVDNMHHLADGLWRTTRI
ncbi:unnamed protein product [Pedinophyceae sp. YPF-701]|nr:unnamed protein product [Pedinophyceae sp. YPF-701]